MPATFFTASSHSRFHPPLSLVFFFQSSSSPAFLTYFLTQSSHLSLVLPRLLLLQGIKARMKRIEAGVDPRTNDRFVNYHALAHARTHAHKHAS